MAQRIAELVEIPIQLGTFYPCSEYRQAINRIEFYQIVYPGQINRQDGLVRCKGINVSDDARSPAIGYDSHSVLAGVSEKLADLQIRDRIRDSIWESANPP